MDNYVPDSCPMPNLSAEEPKPKEERTSGTKKKPTMLKAVTLNNFVVDNEIRAVVGLKKVNIRQPKLVCSSSFVPPDRDEKQPRKGIRREKRPTRMKKEILEAREQGFSIDTGVSFSTSPLDEKVIELLIKLKKQANTLHKANPTKARAKRTFVCGLHECLKHIKADNVRCVILARNLDAEVTSAVSLFQCLREECLSRGTPIIPASTKRLLSRALEKFPYTNVVALMHFQGHNELFHDIIELWLRDDSRIHYHIDQTSLFA